MFVSIGFFISATADSSTDHANPSVLLLIAFHATGLSLRPGPAHLAGARPHCLFPHIMEPSGRNASNILLEQIEASDASG